MLITTRNFGLLLAMAVLAAQPIAAADETETLAQLPHVADEVMVRWGVPGMSLAVVRSDQVLFSGGFGVTRVGGDEVVTADTVFGVGSVTKPITAASVALLVDEEKLAWDEPVVTWLPEFRLQDPHASAHATPRDLLAHRVGLPRHDLVWYGSGKSRAELVGLLPHLAFLHELRQDFEYTNLMYVVAGFLVGTSAGSTYEDFVSTRVFEPLGMAHSGFIPPAGEGTARPHVLGSDGELDEIPMFTGGAAAPAAGLYSSANDLASFVQMVLRRGATDGGRLVTEEEVTEILTPQIALRTLGPRELPITGYGLGWFLSVYRGHLFAWHSGSTDGYHAFVGVLPYDDLGVVVLTNRRDHETPEVLSRWVFDRLLGLPGINWHAALKEQDRRVREVQHDAEVRLDSIASPDESPTRPRGEYVGVYRNPGYGRLEVTQRDDELAASFHGFEGPLRHLRGDLFVFELPRSAVVPSFLVGFVVDPENGVTAAWSPLQRDLDPIVFARTPARAAGEH
jgi:CubicO group peptidase (beta-lactamase class C family)